MSGSEPAQHTETQGQQPSPVPHYSASYAQTPGAAPGPMPSARTVSPQEYDALLRRLSAAESTRTNMERNIRSAGEKNRKLVEALTRAKAEIERLRVSLAQQVMPPLNSALILAVGTGRTTYTQLADGKTPAETEDYLDVQAGGRLVRVPISPLLERSDLAPGMTVLLNEQSEAVLSLGYEGYGDVVTVREVLTDAKVLIDTASGSQQVARIGGALASETLRTGDAVTLDTRTRMITAKVPASRSQELVLEEIPDISYAQIGGLTTQLEQIRDAVELPYLHPEIFERYHLAPPKGILLYGPPGNGKTMIAKAVAHALAERAAALNPGANTRGYFLNIKGPELLDKFVGETERQIRDIFTAAREKAQAGHPVVVFFDEMESLFRTRGTGLSSDIETTIVPQLLAEIDGVESLKNVIVIGATNREDLIDAAVMRPGRLDLKIRINRPDAAGAAEIFALYLTDDLPFDTAEVDRHGSVDAAVQAMISAAVQQLYSRTPANAYAIARVDSAHAKSGAALTGHTLYRGDFASGAVIRNIVDRAKKQAIKEQLDSLITAPGVPPAAGEITGGIGTRHLLEAVRAEFEDQVELPPLPDIEDALAMAGVRGRIVSVEPAHTAARAVPDESKE